MYELPTTLDGVIEFANRINLRNEESGDQGMSGRALPARLEEFTAATSSVPMSVFTGW